MPTGVLGNTGTGILFFSPLRTALTSTHPYTDLTVQLHFVCTCLNPPQCPQHVLQVLSSLGLNLSSSDEDDSEPKRPAKPVHKPAAKPKPRPKPKPRAPSTTTSSESSGSSSDEESSHPNRRHVKTAPTSPPVHKHNIVPEDDRGYIPDRDERQLGPPYGVQPPRVPHTYIIQHKTDIASKAKAAKARPSYTFANTTPRDVMITHKRVERGGPGAYSKNTLVVPFGKQPQAKGSRPAGHNTRGRPVWT